MSIDLSALMEFYHPIRVHADGTVTDAEPGIYAPEVYDEYIGTREEGYAWDGGKWSLMRGYTGQYSYNGPCMHPSEYIGGRMAEAILATPGVYVVVTVECLTCDDSCEEEDHDNCEIEPAGWTVAYIED